MNSRDEAYKRLRLRIVAQSIDANGEGGWQDGPYDFAQAAIEQMLEALEVSRAD